MTLGIHKIPWKIVNRTVRSINQFTPKEDLVKPNTFIKSN